MAHRIERVNSLIRQELSELLQRQVKDPRLGEFIAVTEVATSADLKHAKVFVSQFGNDVERKKVISGLVSASSFFRRELAKSLRMRYIPELHFEWDDSIEHGDHISQLIDQVSHEEPA
ncbi:MAG: 30S ribosome-binding factor RbfA [Chloroflexota bacterium]